MYFLYGKKWMEDGTETLQAYARLILPLSVNGIVEGFAHAVMNEREIKKPSMAWLVSCSFVQCLGIFASQIFANRCCRIGLWQLYILNDANILDVEILDQNREAEQYYFKKRCRNQGRSSPVARALSR